MGTGLYSDTEPLENDNGLINLEHRYRVVLDPNVDYNDSAIPTTDGTETIVRVGAKVQLQRNPTKDGYEILHIVDSNGTYTGDENACLLNEIHFIGDGTSYGVYDRQGNEMDVFTIVTSLIICADDAGDYYLV